MLGNKIAQLSLLIVTSLVATAVAVFFNERDTSPNNQSQLPCLHTSWSGLRLDYLNPEPAIDELIASGVNTLRFSLIWADLQPRKPTAHDEGLEEWKLEHIDHTLKYAHDRGLRINVLLTYSPTWASGAPDTSQSDVLADAEDPGEDPTILPRSHWAPTSKATAQFGKFAGLMAERYAGLVDEYEIWNEPNLARFFALQGTGKHGAPAGEKTLMSEDSRQDRIDRYAAMLTAAGPAIHQGSDGTAKVGFGGVSTSARHDGVDIPAIDFIDGVLKQIPKDTVDAIAVHPYTPGNGPFIIPNLDQPENEFNTVKVIHERTRKPVWITEFGAPTIPEGVPPSSIDPASNMVDETLQTSKILNALDLSERADFIEFFAIYQPRDIPSAGTDNLDPEAHFGLQHSDGRPKDAWGPVTNQFHSMCR